MKDERMPVVLIPSLEPDDRLPAYITQLMENGFSRVVVVNDGSAPSYQPIFDRISTLGATVLGYAVNQGKGEALKTGYRWILEHEPDCIGVLTADADGQHTVPDCLKLAEALRSGEDALWLGSRDFNLPNIPPKSRTGNKLTSLVFKLLYGVWLPDTQTGLRAFPRGELAFMAEVPGARYEYEMNVLIACARRKLPIHAITIETIYENNNEGTHFHPIRDSWRIYKVILGNFFKFMSPPAACSALPSPGAPWQRCCSNRFPYCLQPEAPLLFLQHSISLICPISQGFWKRRNPRRIVPGNAVLVYTLKRNMVTSPSCMT